MVRRDMAKNMLKQSEKLVSLQKDYESLFGSVVDLLEVAEGSASVLRLTAKLLPLMMQAAANGLINPSGTGGLLKSSVNNLELLARAIERQVERHTSSASPLGVRWTLTPKGTSALNSWKQPKSSSPTTHDGPGETDESD
jgi:hypothetical protein